MIQIEEMADSEIVDVLARVGYGHLACCRDNEPYVVPVHFAYDAGEIFVYTTEGKKYEMIKSNPRVCLQVEEVVDNQRWQSVIVDGEAQQIKGEPDRGRALRLIVAVNPMLTPAVSIRWVDSWIRENIEVIYRIRPTEMSGRRSAGLVGRASVVPGHEHPPVN